MKRYDLERDATWPPDLEQGWYWAMPRFPEDATWQVICVWQDDGYWSFGEQNAPLDPWKALVGPIPPPD